MKRQDSDGQDVDPYLRSSLGTKQTGEASARMGRIFEEFRERLPEHPYVRRLQARRDATPGREICFWGGWRWRPAVAVVSACVVFALIWLSPPSEASLGRSLAAIRQAHSFHATGRLEIATRKPILWEVWWQAPDKLRIGYETEGGDSALAQWRLGGEPVTFIREGSDVFIRVTGIPPDMQAAMSDSASQMYVHSLSANFLRGQWAPARELRAGLENALHFGQVEHGRTLQVALDPETRLPVWWRTRVPQTAGFEAHSTPVFVVGEFAMAWNVEIPADRFDLPAHVQPRRSWATLSEAQVNHIRQFSRLTQLFTSSAKDKSAPR